tara:strand:- start:1169 stop:1384 length:216 start_codon:yes stop_codon:yes gene_type:complete
LKKADGLDEAILGTATRPDLPEILVYDYYKCVDIFMENNEWTEEEALEWMDFNVINAYVGKDTPIFVIIER